MCSSYRAKIRGKCSTGMNELPNPSCKPSDICSQIKHSFPQIPGNAERITLLLRSCLTEALARRTHSEDEEGQDFCPAHAGCYKPLGTTSCFNYEHVCMEKVFLGFNLQMKSVNLLRNVPMLKKILVVSFLKLKFVLSNQKWIFLKESKHPLKGAQSKAPTYKYL